MNTILVVLLSFAVLGCGLEHISAKCINKNINPILALLGTFVISFLIITALTFIVYSRISLIENFYKINWSVITLSLSLIAFELSILLAYRFGGEMSKVFNIISPGISISLVLIGVFIYKEHLSVYNFIGLLFSIFGIYQISSGEIKKG